MIAESVPGKEKHLVLPTNPEFIHLFNPGGGSGGSADGAAEAEQFSVSKVWIEDGCIVCNACEDIYPEVFEVTQDSCIIRAGAPLDDGLKILEASDACPVEVIKYNKA
ncbi:MAG: ferredoxin [Bacteriovoracaceae bacterium]|nr:ferredoxin [Bacteriovoracaceae bacterium]